MNKQEVESGSPHDTDAETPKLQWVPKDTVKPIRFEDLLMDKERQKRIEDAVWFYYDECGFDVIPLGKRTWDQSQYEPGNGRNDYLKAPSLKDFDLLEKNERYSREQVKEWLDANKFVNIGIICGKTSDNLISVDIDDPTIVHDLEEKGFNIFKETDKRITVRTSKTEKGNKYQLYVKHLTDPGLRQAESKEIKIDYRANGTYVVAPPSLHPSGVEYSFVRDDAKERLKELKKGDSKKLVKELRSVVADIRGISEDGFVEVFDDSFSIPPCVKRAMEETWEQGMRHDILYSVACAYVQAGIDKDTALKEIKQFNAEKLKPAEQERTVERQVDSAYAPQAKLRGCTYWRNRKWCPYPSKWECPLGKKSARSSLFDTYDIFREDENGNTKFIDVNAAKAIEKGFGYRFITMPGGKTMFYYENGVYKEHGEDVVEKLSLQLLGERYKPYKADTFLRIIKARTFADPSIFEAPVKYINMKNGIYDMEEKKLMGHTPDIKFLSKIATPYDPQATCPRWKQFIETVLPQEEDQLGMQEFFGYTLYRKKLFEVFVFCLGGGTNGKSTLINTLVDMLGMESCSLQGLHDLTTGRFTVSGLHGKLLNAGLDIGSMTIKEANKIKNIVSDEYLTGEKKGKDIFNFKNTTKFIFSANILPESAEKTEAMMKRPLIFNFSHTITEEEKDPYLHEKLQKELPGILNWSLEGLYRLLENQRFSNQKTSLENKKEYIRKSEPVRVFCEEMLDIDYERAIPKDELYDVFENWCEDSNIAPLDHNVFIKKLYVFFEGEGVRSYRNNQNGERMYMVNNISWADGSPSFHKDRRVFVPKNVTDRGDRQFF